jgi:hypothetical protein
MATKQVTAIEAHERLAKEAAMHTTELRRVPSIKHGQAVRQGDIYIHRVAREHPHGAEAKSRQLAIGETQGSRHIAESPATVFVGTALPKWCADGTFVGPCIVSEEPFTITHPEHAHVELPAGVYQITHQSDARTLDRVRD